MILQRTIGVLQGNDVKRKCFRRLIAGLAIGSLAAGPALAVTAQTNAARADAEDVGDVDSYSVEMGISRDDAESQLRLQVAAGDLDAALTSNMGSVFAGLWIEHRPDF